VLAAANPHRSSASTSTDPHRAARALAASAGLDNIRFASRQASTAARAAPDLGDFDVIALHGIWLVAPRSGAIVVSPTPGSSRRRAPCLLQCRARLDAPPAAAADLEYAKRHPRRAARRDRGGSAAKTTGHAGALYFQVNPQVGALSTRC
jgi:hypothetical protein